MQFVNPYPDFAFKNIFGRQQIQDILLSLQRVCMLALGGYELPGQKAEIQA